MTRRVVHGNHHPYTSPGAQDLDLHGLQFQDFPPSGTACNTERLHLLPGIYPVAASRAQPFQSASMPVAKSVNSQRAFAEGRHLPPAAGTT